MGICLPDLGTVTQGGSNHIKRYLRAHGPSIAADIAGKDYDQDTVSKCLLARKDLFEKTGEKRGRSPVWRLRAVIVPSPTDANTDAVPLRRDAIVAYLRTHGPCEASVIAKALNAGNIVHRCLRSNPKLFGTTGEKGHWGADIWQLRDGAA